jgi:hypothetical protein
VTPEQRKRRAQIAALTRWAKCTDRTPATAKGRRASRERFERMVDPDGVLNPRERALRADKLERAHMLTMALRSAEVRRDER